MKLLSLKYWTCSIEKELIRANYAPSPSVNHNHTPFLELIMLQKPLRKQLCVGVNLRQNATKLKLKPTSNYTKSIKTFVISYTKMKDENIMSP